VTGPAEVNHLGQCVTDLGRATRFYVELLGFEVERDLTVPDGPAAALLGVEPPVGLRAVYLRRGDLVLELMVFDRPGNPGFTARQFTEPGLTHLSFSVDDLAAAVARVEELGGQVVTHLGDAAAMVRDPDGQLLELLPMSYRDSLGASLGDGLSDPSS
jgi:catechol 2,3-dioxygenase-like lactoylglutathione lyase family enzyme